MLYTVLYSVVQALASSLQFAVSASGKAGNRLAAGLASAMRPPNSECSDGVDIDFFSTSVPGSLGALVGQGVRGT